MRNVRRIALLVLLSALLAPAGAAAAPTIKPPPVKVLHGDGNFTQASRPPSSIRYVVIHVTEGRFWGSVDWLTNDRSEASANYVVSRAGHIVQLVHLSDIAWHAGNMQMNRESVGVEHVGITDHPAGFTKIEYRESARLVAWLCRRSLIPIDRQHIIGHSEVPGANHTDPGRYWDWDHYMKLVHEYANPAPPLRIRSATVRDGQTLAGTVPWRVETTGPKPTRVEFSIDGKRRWTDHQAPFSFGGGLGLKTVLLPNGPHKLRAVAFGPSGGTATDTVALRVGNRKLHLTTVGIRPHARIAGVVKLRADTTVPTPAIGVFLDGNLLRRLTTKPFTLSLDVRKLVDGRHTIVLRTTAFDGRSVARRLPVLVRNPKPKPKVVVRPKPKVVVKPAPKPIAKPVPKPVAPKAVLPKPVPLVPLGIVSQSVADGQVVQGVVAWQVAVRGAPARVEFLVDGVVRGTATAAPYSAPWDTAPEAAGPHALVVRLVAKDGTTMQSAAVSVTVASPTAAYATDPAAQAAPPAP